MPVIWNVVIIATLLVVVPRFESEEAQLYVYAAGVLAGHDHPDDHAGVVADEARRAHPRRARPRAIRRSSGCWS